MALIKCSECGRDISDKAPACPNCGNPLNQSGSARPVEIAGALSITPELTSKKWKKVKLIAWIFVVAGFFVMTSSGGMASGPGMFSLGIIILFASFVALIVGYIGAWYNDRRTS